jgi:hypothetical protein
MVKNIWKLTALILNFFFYENGKYGMMWCLLMLHEIRILT